jgi:lipoprotein-anchoring transpeptidase ErfK/SrfK
VSGFLVFLLASACSPAVLSPAAPSAVALTYEPTPAYILPTDSWIEVDLGRQVVFLHEETTIIAEYAASSGIEGYETPPGLYRVQTKEKGPIENVPGVWVSDILIFDWGKGNGIHSMPTDAEGRVLDPTLGEPTTGGCVRVAQSARVFDFAEVGTRVWIH